jgi:hypothetical protein
MQLTLYRRWLLPRATEGVLHVNGTFECYTLEDPVRIGPKVPGQTAIPYGRYRVRVSWSPRFRQMMPELLDVPGFTGIRVHVGNRPEDSDGCILLGAQNSSVTDAWVSQSRVAYGRLLAKLMAAQDRQEPIWIDIVAEPATGRVA